MVENNRPTGNEAIPKMIPRAKIFDREQWEAEKRERIIGKLTLEEQRRNEGEEVDSFLTPGDVILLFRVSNKVPRRWAKSGKLEAIRTPGGHRRYRGSSVRNLYVESLRGNR